MFIPETSRFHSNAKLDQELSSIYLRNFPFQTVSLLCVSSKGRKGLKIMTTMTTMDSLHPHALTSLGKDTPRGLELPEASINQERSSRGGLLGCSCPRLDTPLPRVLADECSPPTSPRNLIAKSPVRSRRGSMKMQSMDDSYCERLRSTRCRISETLLGWIFCLV